MARKVSNEEKKGSPEWMNTYSDLVTLLLCFFVLMFSMSNVDAAKFKAFINSFNDSLNMFFGGETLGSGSSIGSGINQLPDYDQMFEKELKDNKIRFSKNKNKEIAAKFQEFIQNKGLNKQIKVDYNEHYVKLLFVDDSILFDTGKAILKKGAIDTLNVVCEKLGEYKKQLIKIEGHTDNVPIKTDKFPSNWYLSSARAISVAEYLINKKGFNPKNISANGRGEYSPIASNDTLEGRAKNRRVEIMIFFDNIPENLNLKK